MDKYQKKQFILDLLKANQGMSAKDRDPIDGFCDSFMDGVAKNNDLIDVETLGELRKTPMLQLIKQMEEVDPESGLFDRIFGNVEKFIAEFSETTSVEHKGQSFDPKIISDKYRQVKDQFVKYGDSQDIKNL
jgi:hypothetical protein